MRVGQCAYSPLLTVGVLFLCGGFMLLPIARRSAQFRRDLAVRRVSRRVEHVWRRVTPDAVKLRDGLGYEDPEMTLHRYLIEIEDAVLSPDLDVTLSQRETTIMRTAQSRLGRHMQVMEDA